MHDGVKYEVKNGVVTLTGEVNSQQKRDLTEKVATKVPNVTQVVNDLQVKKQKASSSQQGLRSPATSAATRVGRDSV